MTDTLKEYILFNKPAIKKPEQLTPEEAKEVLLEYIEYQTLTNEQKKDTIENKTIEFSGLKDVKLVNCEVNCCRLENCELLPVENHYLGAPGLQEITSSVSFPTCTKDKETWQNEINNALNQLNIKNEQ